MKHNNRFVQLACALTLTSPLAAQWQDCGCNEIYNRPYWESCESSIYLELDYLLWFAIQDGISPHVTVETRTEVDDGFFTSIKSKDAYFHNNWDSGVRAVVGFKPPCKDWDVRLGYTHFFTQESKNGGPVRFFQAPLARASAGAFGQQVVPEFINPAFGFGGIPFPTVSKNKSHWRLTFNQLDVDFGREFYVASDVTLRPFFGVRAVETNERLQLFFKRSLPPEFGPSFSSLGANADMDGKSHFRGVGAKGGFDTTISLTDGFDLYGSFAGSILWGYSRIRQAFNQDILFSEPRALRLERQLEGSLDLSNHSNHSHQATVFNLDLGVGFRWNQWMNCGRSLLSFKFGWEQHIFSNLNQLQDNTVFSIFEARNVPGFNLDNNVYRGYLSLSGFQFGLSYCY